MTFLKEVFEYGETLLNYFEENKQSDFKLEIWQNIAEKAEAIHKRTPAEHKKLCGDLLTAFQDELDRRYSKKEENK